MVKRERREVFFCWEELMYQVEGHLIAESHISCIS